MSLGALCARRGVLYVARCDRAGHVRAYDLDGRALSSGFAFRASDGVGWRLAGLAVDEDHQVWLGDRARGRAVAYTLFGREGMALSSPAELRPDSRGSLSDIVDLALAGTSDEEQLLVARAGVRRHALQLFDLDGRCRGSLRALGSPEEPFRELSAVAALGPWIYACERVAGRVQVFRDREFHFAFGIPVADGAFEPAAVAPLEDGRVLVLNGGEHGALLLVDAAGRLIRVLAESGSPECAVEHPVDVVVDETEHDSRARIAVLDRDAERVQVLSLAGHCHGELELLPGQAS